MFFCFILLTHKGSHREVYQEFQSSYDIFRRWCQGMFKPQVPCTHSYTAQLLTLYQHRANNQYRMADQIYSTLRVSSNTQATLEQSPVHVQPSIIFLDFSDCTRTGFSKFICRSSLSLRLLTQFIQRKWLKDNKTLQAATRSVRSSHSPILYTDKSKYSGRKSLLSCCIFSSFSVN